MMRYIVGIASAIVIISACSSAPQPKQDVAKQEKPVPPPPPIDSVAKADSILNLKYDKNTYPTTLKELARWDSCAANQVDSGVVYLTTKIKGMWMAKSTLANLDTVRYKDMYKHAADFFETYDSSKRPYFPGREKRVQMVVFKPVIYLYPTKETTISVNLGFDGTDLYTWPQIDTNLNWAVTAKPNGMLTGKDGEEYPYLFWEGRINNFNWINPNEGFVVGAANTETFLREKLKYLGLNSREYTDFITFWGPRLRESKYNLIRFETTSYDGAIPLKITPAPESTQRIMMVYKHLDNPIEIKTQELLPFTRKGFTVIEWGGMEMPKILN